MSDRANTAGVLNANADGRRLADAGDIQLELHFGRGRASKEENKIAEDDDDKEDE